MSEDPTTETPVETTTELTPAQIEALDRDGDGKAGGSKPGKAKAAPAAVGAVVKKGKAGPTPEELGNDPAQLVTVRITDKGDGQVHDGAGGRYDHGDEVILPLGVAQGLRGETGDKKALGYVEILGKV